MSEDRGRSLKKILDKLVEIERRLERIEKLLTQKLEPISMRRFSYKEMVRKWRKKLIC